MTPATEDLLRDALDRLRRQEQRTAALEEALRDSAPPAAHPITQTPSLRAGDTHFGPKPRPKPEPTPGPVVTPAAVLASLDDVVWSVSPDGQLVFFVAGAVERLYGLTEHDLTNHRGRWLDVLPGADRERLCAALARLPGTDTFSLEHRVERSTGGRWAVTRGTLVRDRDGRPLRVDGTTTDATAERERVGELEARLATAERRAKEAETVLRGAANLATAGRMAVGVAHDFHNLLGVMAGNADLIREALPEGDPHRETAEAIANAAHTVAGVSRKLLAVGKPGPASTGPLDVTASLRALEPVLRRLVGRAVPVAFDLVSELPLVRADATQLDRVVLNLLLNARDAVAGGGSISVRAAEAHVEPGRPGWPANRPSGKYVAITVADTGCGMPEEVRERVFELFFTTKGDRGTGLGLATVHEAVTAAGGHVEIESEVGWGTQVRVYWPPLIEGPQLRVRG